MAVSVSRQEATPIRQGNAAPRATKDWRAHLFGRLHRRGHRAGPDLADPYRVDPRYLGRPENATIMIPATWAIPKFTLSAYGAVFSATDLGRWYINSAIVAILVTLLTVITASIAGYALSRRRYGERPSSTRPSWPAS